MPLSAEIDSTEITGISQRIQFSPRWNLLDSGIVRFPAGLEVIDEGVSELHLYNSDDELVFSGPAWYTQSEGGPDAAYTEITAWDHRIYLSKLMCKKPSPSGAWNLIRPTSVVLTEVTAPQILAAFIQNAIDDPAVDTPTGPVDSKPLPLTVGTVDTSGEDVTGVPMDWPMTIERMRSLLQSTGQLDQVLHPGVGGSTLDLLDDYSNDLSGSIKFAYAITPFNCQVATKTRDMKDMVNALWYLLGPRCSPLRWKGSITPTAPHPAGTWPTGLSDRFEASREDYGYMQEINIFDDEGGECDDTTAGANAIRPLYEEQWANEAWIRAMPRNFVSVRPRRGLWPDGWGVGDLIAVEGGTVLNGGFAGAQHIYGYDWVTDFDGVDEITEMVTSADQVGATGAT